MQRYGITTTGSESATLSPGVNLNTVQDVFLVSFEEVASVTSLVRIYFYSHVAELEVENFLRSMSHHTGKTGQMAQYQLKHRTALIESIHPKVSETLR